VGGSKASERLLHEALARKPHRKIQGLAYYYLGRFLDDEAAGVRNWKMFDRARLEGVQPIQKESWGYDYIERILSLDPEALEREAASLYDRVVNEIADILLPNPLPLPSGDRLLPGQPTTCGEAARAYLREVRDLGLGRPAHEIEGVDLDGRPMKLSDYRGKIVALYFCSAVKSSANGTNKPALVT
jgi:hypothetical protein